VAEKTRQIDEAAGPEGGRGCAVHVRWFPSRPRAHESQCVFFTCPSLSKKAHTTL
jgi:hypothetical protein